MEQDNSWLDRLKIEHDELQNKIEKLQSFIDSDKYNKLNLTIQLAMSEQLFYMAMYLKTLDVRLMFYNDKDNESN